MTKEYSDKLFNLEAEKAVIGSVLLNPNARYEVDISPDDFFIERHRIIWDSVLKLDKDGSEIDIITLEEKSKVEFQYLSSLIDNVPSALYIADYAKIVKSKAKRRKYFEIARELVRISHSDDDDSIVEPQVGRIVDNLISSNVRSDSAVHISIHTSQVLVEMEERHADPKEYWGMQTGFIDFDNITGGLQKSENFIVSGEAGIGKSLLTMQMGVQLAEHSYPGAIFSLEMQANAVSRRMMSSKSKVPTRKIKSGQYSDQDYHDVLNSKIELDNLPIFISQATELDLIALRADLARLKRSYGIQWFILDYMFLMNAGRVKDETEATTVISRGLKGICKSLDIAGISIHSLTKDTGNGKPNLRGSGQVRYDADLILLMAKDEKNPNEIICTFDKGRELERDKSNFSIIKQTGYPFFGNCFRTRY